MLSSRPNVNMSQVVSILKVDIIYGRLYLGALYLCLFLHTSGCFLILIGKQSHLYGHNSYIMEYTSGVNDNIDMYIQALFFILTTFTTVGFGDIYPQNMYEVGYLMFLEFIGVFGFSYIMGTIASILNAVD